MDDDIVCDIDISNDPEVERLGANATAVYALQHWQQLTAAARRDALELDPIWATDASPSASTSTASMSVSSGSMDAVTGSRISIGCRHTKEIVLTKSDEFDVRLWKRFRSNFTPFFFNVKDIGLPSLKNSNSSNNNNNHPNMSMSSNNNNPLVSEQWRNLLLACEGSVDDYNFLTLLRPHAHTMLHDSFTKDGTRTSIQMMSDLCIVPRAQFLFIEIARIREGDCYNGTFRQALQCCNVTTVAEKLQVWLLQMQMLEESKNSNNTTTGTSTTPAATSTIRQLVHSVQELQSWWPYPPCSRILQTTGVIYALKRVLAVTNNSTTSTTTTLLSSSTCTTLLLLHDACLSLWQQWHDISTLGRLLRHTIVTTGSSNTNTISERRQVAALERAARALTQQRQPSSQPQQHHHQRLHVGSSSYSSSKVLLPPIVTQADVTCHNVTSISCQQQSSNNNNNSSSCSGGGGGGGGGLMSATGTFAAGAKSSSSAASSDPSAVHEIFQKHGLIILPNYLIPNNNNNTNKHGNKYIISNNHNHNIQNQNQHHEEDNDFLHLHRVQAKQALDDLSNVLQQDFGVQVDGPDMFDFVEVRQRPGHRVDYRYDLLNNNNVNDNNSSSSMDSSDNPANDLAQRLVQELPRLLFSNNQDQGEEEVKLRVLHAGVVHAFGRKNSADEPVPPAQIWHRDGPSLFTEKSDQHHDTHCFNVFIPLVDVEIANGTTQFIPGTHVDAVYNEVAPEAVLLAQQQQQQEHKNGSSSVQEETRQHERAIAAIVPAGTMIIFDIRLLHRGLSNTLIQTDCNNGTTADRPLLYFTMARDWFREEHMFQQQSSLKQHRDKDFIMMQQEMQTWCTQLYQTVTGQTISSSSSSSSSSSYNGNSTPKNSSNNNDIKYGHPHYTLRFDLLLLEAVMALSIKNNTNDDKERTRLITTITSAILAFCSRSTSDKLALCQEWIQVLSRSEFIECKLAALAEASRERRQRQEQQQDEDIDFTNIQQDMSDVAALYRVTARLLLKETTLLSRLGFPMNEFGVCFTLSLLKAWAASTETAIASSTSTSTSNTDVIDDNGNNNSLVARLEESFSSWWHAGKSRFDFQDGRAGTRNERSERMLLVVFSSLGSGIARPEWKGSIRQSISTEDDGYINTSPASSVKWDVLHVLDPSFSWYTQDPTCSWKGYDYYSKQLETQLADYKGVIYLGDSMGAAAALRFSLLADAVLAFTPQVDITSYEAITRTDLSLTVRQRFQQELLYAVSNTKAKITIHYGKDCAEDVRQVGLLPGGDDESSGIKLVSHEFDDHVLSLHLRDQGMLTDMVKDAIEDFVLTSLK